MKFCNLSEKRLGIKIQIRFKNHAEGRQLK